MTREPPRKRHKTKNVGAGGSAGFPVEGGFVSQYYIRQRIAEMGGGGDYDPRNKSALVTPSGMAPFSSIIATICEVKSSSSTCAI